MACCCAGTFNIPAAETRMPPMMMMAPTTFFSARTLAASGGRFILDLRHREPGTDTGDGDVVALVAEVSEDLVVPARARGHEVHRHDLVDRTTEGAATLVVEREVEATDDGRAILPNLQVAVLVLTVVARDLGHDDDHPAVGLAHDGQPGDVSRVPGGGDV